MCIFVVQVELANAHLSTFVDVLEDVACSHLQLSLHYCLIYISVSRKRHKIVKYPVRHVALGAAGQLPFREGFGCVDRKFILGGALELHRGPITEVEGGLRALDEAEDALVGEGGGGAGKENSNKASRNHWRWNWVAYILSRRV